MNAGDSSKPADVTGLASMFKHLRPLLLAGPLLGAAACVGPSIAQYSPGIYKVVCAGSGGMSTTDADTRGLKSEAVREAQAFARREGKVAIPVFAAERHVVEASMDTTDRQTGLQDHANGGNWVVYTYLFELVDKADPNAQVTRILVREKAEHGPNAMNPYGGSSLGGFTVFYDAQPAQ
ncbi:MAG TPA: hypothetical protein VGF85_07645 [Opitutaceae bacterium]|jgi:hypothetical protein